MLGLVGMPSVHAWTTERKEEWKEGGGGRLKERKMVWQGGREELRKEDCWKEGMTCERKEITEEERPNERKELKRDKD